MKKMIQVFEEDKWVTKPSEEVLDRLVDKGSTILRVHYRRNTTEIENDMTYSEIDKVLDWLRGIVNNNEKIRKPIKDKLLTIMDTYRYGV